MPRRLQWVQVAQYASEEEARAECPASEFKQVPMLVPRRCFAANDIVQISSIVALHPTK